MDEAYPKFAAITLDDCESCLSSLPATSRLLLFWGHLNLARKRPASYRKFYGQKPPRNVFDEYVNMVCRRYVRMLADGHRNHESARIELQKKVERDILDQALAKIVDESIETEAARLN